MLSLVVEELLNNIDVKYKPRSGHIGPRFYLRSTSSESSEMGTLLCVIYFLKSPEVILMIQVKTADLREL